MKKSKIYYLLTIPRSLENAVCKTYLHILIDTIEVLELLYILLYAVVNGCGPGFHIKDESTKIFTRFFL